MIKYLFKFFLILLTTSIFIAIYLSYLGIETDRFDSLIKNKTNESNQYVKLEFQKTKIHLNIKEFDLVVKLQKPKVLVKNQEIKLSKVDLYLPLKSFFTSDFLLKRAEIAFKENSIKDFIKITNIFLPRFLNKKLDKIFKKGNLEGNIIIPIKTDGSIGKDYAFSGKISDATINLTKEFSIQNLTAEVKNVGSEETSLIAAIKKGNIFEIDLTGTTINLNRHAKKNSIESFLHTNGKFTFSQIKKITSILNFDISSFTEINGIGKLKTGINFDLNKNFKINNIHTTVSGDISYFEIHTKKNQLVKKFLPNYNSKIILKDTNVKFNRSNSNQTLELKGLFKANDKLSSFKVNKKLNLKEKKYDLRGYVDLTNEEVKITKLNYSKNQGIKSNLNFNINFILNKNYNIKNLNFSTDKDKIYLSEIELNDNFEIGNFKKLEVLTYQDEIKNNDFLVEKSKKIVILGDVFDAEPFLKSLYKSNKKKDFSKNFTNEIKINFKKIFTGTNDNVSSFSMVALIKEGSYNKLSLKGNFSKDERIEMSIYQIDKDRKTLHVISDRARPFVKNFNFIKGFEGGKLEYESNIFKDVTKSNLTITDFKVSKVPAFAQLLSLASLQGISDTLSGEGIRFDSFEMKSNSSGNVLNIEDALAIGPAVSILLNGYVDKGKIVSLKGTLVPATKLNSIIASIPVVGNILVGKKAGEGVVGVSFKMKGPPKDIKTSVNPIKTLTPRFIVRAIDKMKKKKKEKVK